MIFRPMKAEHVELEKLTYPRLVSPKIDGFRAVMLNGQLTSSSGKPIRNKAVMQKFNCDIPLDGELVAGDPRAKDCFRTTSSIVTTHDASAKQVMYFVFDTVGNDEFAERLVAADRAIQGIPDMVLVPHTLIETEAALLRMEDEALKHGYEGLMIRDPRGKYKFGRSTVSEGLLLKMKRFHHGEATIIGFVEQMHNANEAKIDNHGYTERSSHQANMIPMGTLGSLLVKDLETGVEFSLGTGFTAEDRKTIWENQSKFIGKIAKYKSDPIGVKDKPRKPVYLSFVALRPKEDMSV